MHHLTAILLLAALAITTHAAEPLRVFIFAGQSNMEGADSKVADIDNFPPFKGLAKPQKKVRFAYSLGRENKTGSGGWTDLQPVRDMVGPELSFARKVAAHSDGPIAIIKCAAGGTHLGGDWNPDDPQGFKMYPLALELVRSSLAALEKKNINYRLEGFMWHQGENDMFNEQYMADYGKNLANFFARWRADLKKPDLKFYVGELCTKTIWGMDLRPRMYAISKGQKAVCAADPLAEYIPTSHVGVEIGGGVGLHYHYGTLGQLQHGENYADAYLRTVGVEPRQPRKLARWPYAPGSAVRLFVLAGHRNMEGERAFTQQLAGSNKALKEDDRSIAFRYSLGGGVYQSGGWEPLGPSGLYHNFGPELTFARTLRKGIRDNIAIAKFTHSGTQMNDWTPEGSMAETRHLYPAFIDFIKTSVDQLQAKGHRVELAGVFYHIGENDMSMPPYRKQTPDWLKSTIDASRTDLNRPGLRWFVSQQPPTDDERVNEIEVTSRFAALADADKNTTHIKAFDLPEQQKKLVLDTPAILRLGEIIANTYLETAP